MTEVIKGLRSAERYTAMYNLAEMTSTIGVTPTKTRITLKQQHGGNVPADSIAEHCRLSGLALMRVHRKIYRL